MDIMDIEEVGEEMTYLVSSHCEGSVEKQDSMFCPFCQISVNQLHSEELAGSRASNEGQRYRWIKCDIHTWEGVEEGDEMRGKGTYPCLGIVNPSTSSANSL
jgi:hypothetical protein